MGHFHNLKHCLSSKDGKINTNNKIILQSRTSNHFFKSLFNKFLSYTISNFNIMERNAIIDRPNLATQTHYLHPSE